MSDEDRWDEFGSDDQDELDDLDPSDDYLAPSDVVPVQPAKPVVDFEKLSDEEFASLIDGRTPDVAALAEQRRQAALEAQRKYELEQATDLVKADLEAAGYDTATKTWRTPQPEPEPVPEVSPYEAMSDAQMDAFIAARDRIRAGLESDGGEGVSAEDFAKALAGEPADDGDEAGDDGSAQWGRDYLFGEVR